MVNQMEKVFEATLYYCLRVIMKTTRQNIGHERVTVKTDEWNTIINQCYTRFCSPEARSLAAKQKSSKLSNTLVQLHDFSSVVEAKRLMKAGDVGRLMHVWKKWSLMTQGLTGLTNYSSYLPRLVLLLTVILPPAMRTYLSHNLLFSPSGREDHFVAKDQWLEVKNYWLKFLFNKHGKGTQIDRLRDLFSVNIDLLQEMYHSLQRDCGAKKIHQSHKNKLTHCSLEMFMMMANSRDILVEFPDKADEQMSKIGNTYLLGLSKMKHTICTTDPDLKKYKKHLFSNDPEHVSRADHSDDSTDSSEPSLDM
ncbi:hypothetical protein PSTG_03478 [Puccinia striiformis f. sp. tritici PST-78]|uniref:DUF6589 domain-containing protein n=1 Tax=Puccinia striiformis f. sp. tritici PST-78 TaxID=1165861 RepID=A0A0L0VVA9_9BASI|nr:hypothetical protein PSTG_03478 [Puccinia striiformis f. sp. tritici PST-78]